RGTWVSFRWFLRGRTVDRSALVEVRLGRAVALGLDEAGALRREGHEDRGEAGVVVAEVDLGALGWPSVPRRVDLGDALDEVRDGSGDGRVVLQLAARGVGAQARGLDDVRRVGEAKLVLGGGEPHGTDAHRQLVVVRGVPDVQPGAMSSLEQALDHE